MTLIIAGQYAAALIAILSLFGMFVKWAVVKPIKQYIDHATYPIQKTSNGGYALPDLVRSVDEIKVMISTHLDDHEK